VLTVAGLGCDPGSDRGRRIAEKIEQAPKNFWQREMPAPQTTPATMGSKITAMPGNHAVRTQITPPIYLANGHAQLGNIERTGERIIVQASSNLTDWVDYRQWHRQYGRHDKR